MFFCFFFMNKNYKFIFKIKYVIEILEDRKKKVINKRTNRKGNNGGCTANK